MDMYQPIGVFDSGLGGVSVLRAVRATLPYEDFIYYGDSVNAPYGTRPEKEILALSMAAISALVQQGVKAVVIACNTVTSVAAPALRAQYPQTIIVATEPAVKPAAADSPQGRIVVMATPATLQGERFHHLMGRFQGEAVVIPCPCPGLMEFVERGETHSERLRHYLEERFRAVGAEKPDSVVLGCTHYPFVQGMIQEVAGPQAKIFDGASGIARQLKQRLAMAHLLSDKTEPGEIVWQNSSPNPELIAIGKRLLEMGE